MMTSDPLWQELETQAQAITDAGILKRLISPDSHCTMYLGVQQPSLHRAFLLEVPRRLLPSREQIPESNGFELSVQVTGNEPETHATFVLIETSRDFDEIFAAMVQNLSSNVRDCRDDRLIVSGFLNSLRNWQEFFERNRGTGLSGEEQRGLYGELSFLRNHVLSVPERFSEEVSGWTGPRSRQHDFQYSSAAVEVKTTSGRHPQRLLISGENQLDETLIPNLFVFHMSLAAVENGAATLPALIEELRTVLGEAPAARTTFEELLAQAGYFDSHAWKYEKTGYAVSESHIFRVSGDFPRLTSRDLPPGVGDLSYSIGVAECRKHAVSMDDVLPLIRENRHE